MTFRFCPVCGRGLVLKEVGDEGLTPFCNACALPFFSFSWPCVICLVVNEDKRVALIRQSGGFGRYVCVAGFVRQGESAERAAEREVEEEIGLKVSGVEFIRSYYHEKGDNLMLGFVCWVEGGRFRLSKEVEAAEWFSFGKARELLRDSSVAKLLLEDYLSSGKFI